ncbi:MAG: hypothetical protein ACLQVI_42350, partial [Polyangiaceae bacterium]
MNHVIRAALTTTFLALVLALGACVPQAKYDASVKDAQQARADAQQAHAEDLQRAADLTKANAQIDQLNASIRDLQARASERDKALSDALGNAQDLQAKLDGAIAE